MSWGQTIRATRLRQGLKQAHLAGILGLDQATVSRWERGNNAPSLAEQRRVLSTLDKFDPETKPLQYLFERVVKSPYRLLLTEPGEFTSVASSESAREYFHLDAEPFTEYRWEEATKTFHQKYIYEKVVVEQRLFNDKTITHVQSTIALNSPLESGSKVFLNNAVYYPIWTGESQPRLIIKIEGRTEYDGRAGLVIVHRSTDPPQAIVIPNE